MTRLSDAPNTTQAKRPARVVRAGDMLVSADPRKVLTTASLGSSVALALYDWVERVGGVIHCVLPRSKVDPDRARFSPATFVDTGVPALIEEMLARGARLKNLVATVVGASSSLGGDRSIRIAQRNITVLRRLLWRNDLLIERADVGGTRTRALTLYLEDGCVIVRTVTGEIPL